MNTIPATWEPPAKGSWTLAADHYPRPVTAAVAPLMHVWSNASTEYFRSLGLPVTSARMELVNGLPYVSMGGGGPQKPPPPWLMNMMVRLMPSMRRADRRLSAVLTERPWIAGVAQWYSTDRPAAITGLRALTEAQPDSLDETGLAVHLETVDGELRSRMRQHILLHAHDTLPPGLFVVAARKWGIAQEEATALLTGASPASTGSSDELTRLRAATAGQPVATIDELRALGPETSSALDEFMLIHGWRLIDSYDVDGSCLAEHPELIVSLATAAPRRHDDHAERRAAARAKVPEGERAEFDRLLDEGRAAYGLRDDNGGILIAWPGGLMRRALLAAGRRLASTGRLDHPGLAIEATPGELASALREGAPVDSGAMATRHRFRTSMRAADAPRTLGPPEPPMPPGVNGALGTVIAVFDVYGFGTATPAEQAMRGEGFGSHPYTGTARLVVGADPDAIARFEPGDVLVAPMTSPSYNLLLSLAGGLITEEGGTFSHAAIMARELGLPAVLGIPGATRRIADGDLVTVDPASGMVCHERRTEDADESKSLQT
jgi:pyruvate,water dikinase